MPQELTPEDQLCLLLARGRFSPEATKRAVELMEAGLDWDVVLERGRLHGLVPLLYHRLRALDFHLVPERARRILTDTFGVNAIRNMVLTDELASVVTRLGEAGVRVIPLKGIPLAESLYGDPALRICADLDILIIPENLPKSLQLLRGAGYGDNLRSAALALPLAHYGKDCLLIREDNKSVFALQVHCGLIWGGPVERHLLADIWSEAAPVPFHGAPAYAMTPEWEFLYLAIHAARHGLFPFKWLVDLDWLIVRSRVDWQKVNAMARRLGWERTVQSCFAACETLFDTPVPEPFADTAPRTAKSIRTSPPGALQTAWETLFSVRLLPTFGQKVQFLAIRLFVPTPADYDFLPLPSSLFFLYFFLRPWRLIFQSAGWIIQTAIAKLSRRP